MDANTFSIGVAILEDSFIKFVPCPEDGATGGGAMGARPQRGQGVALAVFIFVAESPVAIQAGASCSTTPRQHQAPGRSCREPYTAR